ncbi:sigma 54-interacting transcriptional regulator [Chitinophaga sp.]|uniref:sigma-54 interaction domain-containing protein n=1 Tax=Chitinophaga sp. TaxID=1869181 RepID=UPI0031E1B129
MLIGITDAEGMIAFWWLNSNNRLSSQALPDRIAPSYLADGSSKILELQSPDRRDAFQTTLFKNGVKEVLLQPLRYHEKAFGFLCLLADSKATFSNALQQAVTRSAAAFAVGSLQVLILSLTEKYRQEIPAALPAVIMNKGIIGGDALQPVLQMVAQVAPTDATVLITGETGTGKELIAEAVHRLSPRSQQAMVKVNCAALPPNLIESELFGHEKGAFTGALQMRIGKFEQADKGTLFLDEVGELPLELQAKLLRVLQEREIERLGGAKTIRVDVRIVAATNRNLEEDVANKKFREDLYYRLFVFPIHLPPLRERKDDIPLLLQHFTGKAALRYGRNITGINPACLPALLAYGWPGNIRELENTVERAVIIATGPYINIMPPISRQVAASDMSPPLPVLTLADAERNTIIRALQQCNGRIRGPGGAAAILEIKPTTLEARMRKLGIVKEHVVK